MPAQLHLADQREEQRRGEDGDLRHRRRDRRDDRREQADLRGSTFTVLAAGGISVFCRSRKAASGKSRT